MNSDSTNIKPGASGQSRLLRACVRLCAVALLAACLYPARADCAAAGHGMTDRLWFHSGIPQYLHEHEYDFFEDGNSTPYPTIIASESDCYTSSGTPYHGFLNAERGILRLTRCIPEETLNSTITITTAAYNAKNGDPVFITTSYDTEHYSSTIRSTRPLSELLPPGFGLKDFLKPGAAPPQSGYHLFHLFLDLGDKHTDTVARMLVLPYARISKNHPIIQTEQKLLIHPAGAVTGKPSVRTGYDPARHEATPPFVASNDGAFLYSLYAFEMDGIADSRGPEEHGGFYWNLFIDENDEEIFELLEKRPKDLDPASLDRLGNLLGAKARPRLAEKSGGHGYVERRFQPSLRSFDPQNPDDIALKRALLEELDFLYVFYEAWKSLAWQSLVLGWDENTGRFYIKARFDAPNDLSFPDFMQF